MFTKNNNLQFKLYLLNYHNTGLGFINTFTFEVYLDDDRLLNDNFERTEFIRQILNTLNINDPIVFLGHSRGSENALRLAALYKEKTIGAVFVNPVGFRKHKGVRPWYYFWTS